MLAIRLQRLGRKGYPVYRMIVQEAQRSPSSGRVVAYVGSYNPHSKETKLDGETIAKYLSNGAQPSPRVVKLLIENKIKLPKWVEKPGGKKQGATRFPDKLRKNQPAPEPVADEPTAEPVEETPVAETEPETAEPAADAKSEPAPEEKPAETESA
jgi:small subunit ribosomal protein S16